MARHQSLADAVAELVHDGDTRRARGLHPPDPVRRRARDHPPGPPRPDAGPDDARHRLRPADRRRAAPASSSSPGAATRASARCTASATRSRTAGRRRWRSRSTATPGWPTATSPAPPGCRSRCCAATAAPTSSTAHANVQPITCPFTGEELAAVPALNPDVAIVHAQQADRAGNVQLWGITGVQKEAVLAARRSLVTVEEIVDELEPRARRGRAARLGGRPPWPRCPAAPHPSYAHGLLRPRQRLLPRVGRDQPRPRRRFTQWLRRERAARSRSVTDCTADEMMTVAAARALRDGAGRASSASGCPSTAANLARTHARPRPRAGLRVGHDRRQARRAAAVDRRRRAGRDRRRRGQRARDVQLLAAARPDRRRLPRRRPDRPLRQHQHDGDRRLRPPEGAPARRRRRARDRRVAAARSIVDRAPAARARSSSGSTSSRRSGTATARATASGSACAGAGPRRVITDLGVLEPDPRRCELTLTALHPGVDGRAGARGDRVGAAGRADDLQTHRGADRARS